MARRPCHPLQLKGIIARPSPACSAHRAPDRSDKSISFTRPEFPIRRPHVWSIAAMQGAAVLEQDSPGRYHCPPFHWF